MKNIRMQVIEQYQGRHIMKSRNYRKGSFYKHRNDSFNDGRKQLADDKPDKTTYEE